jgi:hypothetical protein
MAKRPNSKKFAAIRAMVRDVEDLIDGGKWSLDRQAAEEWRRNPWAGAGVVICESPPNDLRSYYTYVVSPYVVELSWLMEKLSLVCSDFIDDRYEQAFYGRLADAAFRHMAERPLNQWNPKDLCFAVLREATRAIEEIYGGVFDLIRLAVRIKQITVYLNPEGVEGAAGWAVWWCPGTRHHSLAGERFFCAGRRYRMGETTHLVSVGTGTMHTADYFEND